MASRIGVFREGVNRECRRPRNLEMYPAGRKRVVASMSTAALSSRRSGGGRRLSAIACHACVNDARGAEKGYVARRHGGGEKVENAVEIIAIRRNVYALIDAPSSREAQGGS